jgi:mutator protein MutT
MMDNILITYPNAVCGFIRQNGLILSVSRKNNHLDLGLPGGKVEPGESPEDAVKREMFEETGIIIDEFFAVFEYEGAKNFICRTYEITSWQGTPFSKEGAVVQWVHPSRIIEDISTFRNYNIRLFQHLKLDFPVNEPENILVPSRLDG